MVEVFFLCTFQCSINIFYHLFCFVIARHCCLKRSIIEESYKHESAFALFFSESAWKCCDINSVFIIDFIFYVLLLHNIYMRHNIVYNKNSKHSNGLGLGLVVVMFMMKLWGWLNKNEVIEKVATRLIDHYYRIFRCCWISRLTTCSKMPSIFGKPVRDQAINSIQTTIS